MNKALAFFKKRKYLSAVIIIALIAGGYYWYSKSKSTSTAVQYKTAVAEKGTLTTSVSGSGNVVVDKSANIDPTITGTVSSLAVNIGDSVKKGQLLFTIDNNDLSVSVAKSSASYAQSQSSVESAEASLKQAKATYDADKKSSTATSKQKSADKEKIDAAEASLAASEKSLSASGADFANQRLNAGKRQVVAPIAGTVNAVNIKNGDDLSKLSSGSSRQVPIIIGDLGTLKAQVQVNEVDIPNVSIGQKVMLTFSAIDGLSVSGKVEKMDSLGTLTSGVVTYNVTIGFDTLDPKVRPEMSVSASIITDVKQNVIIVPSSAVKAQNGSSYVQLLVNGSPENKTVEAGASNNTETEIISGLSAGDNVIIQTIASGSSVSSSSATSATSRTSTQNRGGIGLPGLGR